MKKAFSLFLVLALVVALAAPALAAGITVIPLGDSSALDFSDGLAAVKQDGKWGYIDTTGTVVIPLKYTFGRAYRIDNSESSFSEGFAPVYLNGKLVYVDKSGKEYATGFDAPNGGIAHYILW